MSIPATTLAVPAAEPQIAPQPAAAAQRGRPVVRRRPVQRDWPAWAIVLVQVGILIAIIGLWETGARLGWIDAFFWSQPSTIWNTLLIFCSSGDAGVDIAFTFRSTILGFLVGTIGGSLLGVSFWGSRNTAAIGQPYFFCVESCWCSAWGSLPRLRSPQR